jgi:uncharacterized membrane protein
MIKRVKSKAKELVLDHLVGNIIAFFLLVVMTVLLDATGIGAILTGVVAFGYSIFCLELIKTKKARIGAFFGGIFKNFFKKWAAGFLMGLYTCLWSLLLIIPGVVASYRYSQVWNVRAEHPDWPAGPCLAESARLMDGRKLQRFLLDLSFVGWILLATLLVGGSLAARFVNWILPLSPFLLLAVAMWMSLARAIFYREVKNARPQTPDQAEVML